MTNIYNEYLKVNGQWELLGSTEVPLENYALLSGNNDFIGNQSISGDLIIQNGIKFKPSGYFWQLNRNYNVFEGSGETTFMSNKYIYFNTINDVNSKISFSVPSGHIQYNNHNENTPGGFSILDNSGCITVSGIIQNGNTYDLSSFSTTDSLTGYVKRELSGLGKNLRKD